MDKIRLTQFAKGSGCGCKISPDTLHSMLGGHSASLGFADLLVGPTANDDAAVLRWDGDMAVISTTDFFTPIVDDAYDYGLIAGANALSDVYAMGGEPLMAIAILGWPVDVLPLEEAQRLMAGGREACRRAGIPLAGGHSIDVPEPIFGLAVTGKVKLEYLKTNSKAKEGDYLFLTKALGTGLIATATKMNKAEETQIKAAIESMSSLNIIGTELARMAEVNALTDVTGFGIAGHLLEVCEGSGLNAEISLEKLPLLPDIARLIDDYCMPAGTTRNWRSYGERISKVDGKTLMLLADPQTSGGLLICVSEEGKNKVQELLKEKGMPSEPIGRMTAKEKGPTLRVEP